MNFNGLVYRNGYKQRMYYIYFFNKNYNKT